MNIFAIIPLTIKRYARHHARQQRRITPERLQELHKEAEREFEQRYGTPWRHDLATHRASCSGDVGYNYKEALIMSDTQPIAVDSNTLVDYYVFRRGKCLTSNKGVPIQLAALALFQTAVDHAFTIEVTLESSINVASLGRDEYGSVEEIRNQIIKTLSK